MTHIRDFAMRALAATLALACACPGVAQTPAAQVQAPAQKPDPAAATAGTLMTVEQRQQLKAALDKSDELMRAGKIDESIALLEQTDRKHPGDALTAASLGAAFEIKGKNDDALTWIRESVKRDASQHQNSEWLHARILAARIALAKDTRWFEKNSVLGLDFGKDAVPVAPEILPIEQGRIKGAQQLLDQIDYQLAARTKVVQPPDPVLGDLFASAGDFAIASAVSPLDDRQSKLEPGKYYERALEYGAPHADLIRKRLAKYQADFAALPPAPKEEVADYPVATRRFEQVPEDSSSTWIYVGVGTVLTIVLVAVGIVIDRRRRKRAEAAPAAPLPDVD